MSYLDHSAGFPPHALRPDAHSLCTLYWPRNLVWVMTEPTRPCDDSVRAGQVFFFFFVASTVKFESDSFLSRQCVVVPLLFAVNPAELRRTVSEACACCASNFDFYLGDGFGVVNIKCAGVPAGSEVFKNRGMYYI